MEHRKKQNAELFSALTAATKELSAVKKNEKSFSGKYADMKAILAVVNPALEKTGLSICHTVSIDEKGYSLKSMLCHSSGEYIESHIPLIMPKNDMQSLGSAITYARRYATQAFLNLAIADFDDNGGSIAAKTENNKTGSNYRQLDVSKKLSEEQAVEIYALVNGDFSMAERILGFNQCEKLDDIPAENFTRVKNYIQKTKEKVANA